MHLENQDQIFGTFRLSPKLGLAMTILQSSALEAVILVPVQTEITTKSLRICLTCVRYVSES
jgi:hypothetical protein